MTHAERHRRHAFTLIELMVVLVLLAVTAAAAVPAFLGARTTTPEGRMAATLAELLSRTRDAARTSGAPATLVVAPVEGRFWVTSLDSSTTGVLPLAREGVRLGDTDGARIQCRFEATGPATPCALVVRGARAVTVHVDEWSGEIRVDHDRAR